MKRQNISVILFFVLWFIPFHLLANGGPDDGSIIYKSGDPHPLQIADVELISEKLEMTIDGDYTNVHVTYRLHNTANKSTGKIHYGFPIEYVYMDCCDTLLTDEYIHSIQFKYNNEPLPITHSSVNPNANYIYKEEIEVYSENDEDYYGNRERYRKWFYTEFSIPSQDLITLEVEYVVKNSFEDWSTSKSFFSHYSSRQLFYDFSPASYWGNGIIKDFQVIIKASTPLQIVGLPFKLEKSIYTYSSIDFNLNTASPLEISYDGSLYHFTDFVNSKKLKPNQIRSIKASSTQKGYPINNLMDGNINTAWVEGKTDSGINESIEIELANNTKLSAIVIVNGYAKSEKTYYANNRIKKMKVELEIIEDEYQDSFSGEIELEDIPYQSIEIKSFTPMASIVYDGGDWSRQAKRIKLTILDIYKGTSYDDTCISELFLLGYLDTDF